MTRTKVKVAVSLGAILALSCAMAAGAQADGAGSPAGAVRAGESTKLVLTASKVAALDAGGDLEGKVVQISDALGVRTAAEQRALDEQSLQLVGAAAPSSGTICPDAPRANRKADGKTTPVFPCDWQSGHIQAGTPLGSPNGVRDALREVLSAVHLGGSPQVRVLDGIAYVDFPRTFTKAKSLAQPEQVALEHSLISTVMSNSSLSGVSFFVDGDCMAFATALGGDSCSNVIFADIPK